MTIRRSATAGDRVAVLQRAALQDQRLSFLARGLLAAILSRPPGWRTSAERLQLETPKEGRDAIRSALIELETHGYLRRTKSRGERGRWHTEWDLSDEPLDESANAQVSDITAGGTATAQPPSAGRRSVEPSSIEEVESGGRGEEPQNSRPDIEPHLGNAGARAAPVGLNASCPRHPGHLAGRCDPCDREASPRPPGWRPPRRGRSRAHR